MEAAHGAIATVGTPALWIGFILLILALLALDLGVFHRKSHVVALLGALGWSVFWIAHQPELFVGQRRAHGSPSPRVDEV